MEKLQKTMDFHEGELKKAQVQMDKLKSQLQI